MYPGKYPGSEGKSHGMAHLVASKLFYSLKHDGLT